MGFFGSDRFGATREHDERKIYRSSIDNVTLLGWFIRDFETVPVFFLARSTVRATATAVPFVCCPRAHVCKSNMTHTQTARWARM